MARIAQFVVAFALVVGVPAANAGYVGAYKEFKAAEAAAKAIKDADAAANATKDADAAAKAANDAQKAEDAQEAQRPQINFTGISAGATAANADTQIGNTHVDLSAADVKVTGVNLENKLAVGGGGGGGGGTSGDAGPPVWPYVLTFIVLLAIGGLILPKLWRKLS